MGEEGFEQPARKELSLVAIEIHHQRLGIGEGVFGHRHHLRARDGLDHVVPIEHVFRQPPHGRDRGALLIGIDPRVGKGADRLVQFEGVVRGPGQFVVVEDEAILLEQRLRAEAFRNGVGFT